LSEGRRLFTTQSHSEFELECRAAFAFLVARFGFEQPVVESVGRECYVRYHRGPQTVSIAFEPASLPIVELFFPSAGTGERSVPWASRSGVPYARRIPQIRPKSKVFREFLVESAEQLEELEKEFLARP
jgi:hypothetical protein